MTNNPGISLCNLIKTIFPATLELLTSDCPAGSKYDQEETDCVPCEKDSYQPKPKQGSCISCPVGLVTEAKGSVTIVECVEEVKTTDRGVTISSSTVTTDADSVTTSSNTVTTLFDTATLLPKKDESKWKEVVIIAVLVVVIIVFVVAIIVFCKRRRPYGNKTQEPTQFENPVFNQEVSNVENASSINFNHPHLKVNVLDEKEGMLKAAEKTTNVYETLQPRMFGATKPRPKEHKTPSQEFDQNYENPLSILPPTAKADQRWLQVDQQLPLLPPRSIKNQQKPSSTNENYGRAEEDDEGHYSNVSRVGVGYARRNLHPTEIRMVLDGEIKQ